MTDVALSNPRLPAIPQTRQSDPSLQRMADAVKESLETMRGSRGDKLDRAVFMRDLVGTGLIKFIRTAGGVRIQPGDSIPGGEILPGFTPPALSGLEISAAFTTVTITYDAFPWRGVDYIEVRRITASVAAPTGADAATLSAGSGEDELLDTLTDEAATADPDEWRGLWLARVIPALTLWITRTGEYNSAYAAWAALSDGDPAKPAATEALDAAKDALAAAYNAYTLLADSADAAGDMPLIGKVTTPVFTDSVEPKRRYLYYLRLVSTAGIAGPFNREPLIAITAYPPGELLEELTGQISASQLDEDLRTNIELIPTIDASYTAMLSRLSTLEGAGEYSDAADYSADDVVVYEGALYLALEDMTAPAPLPTNPTYWSKIGDYGSLGDAVSALAAQVSDHETRVDSVEGTVSAQSTAISGLVSTVNNSTSGVAATATAVSGLKTRVTAAEGAITSQASSISTLGSGLAATNTQVGAQATALSTTQTNVASLGTAITAATTELSQIQAIVGNDYAALQTIKDVTVGPNGLSASYVVKVDVDGFVSGYGLYSDTAGSRMIFRVNQFAIGSPGTTELAFVVDGTRVVMDGAFIKNLTVTNAQILNLSADKLTTGFLAAGRIQANSITADKIDSRGLSIKDAAGNVILSSGSLLNWGMIGGQPSGIYNAQISMSANGTINGAGGGRATLGGMGAGAFATLNQLNASNISTYIASAAIGSAQIGTAAIDTLRVAGNAVTSSIGAANGGLIGALPIEPSRAAVISVVPTYFYAPQSVIVMADVVFANPGGSKSGYLYIARNGFPISGTAVSLRDGWSTGCSLTAIDQPGAGAHTYSIYLSVSGNGGGGTDSSSRSIVALATLR